MGLLTINEFCTTYGVGRTRCYELLAAGKIEAVKVGVSTRILPSSAELWVASLPRLKPTTVPGADPEGVP
jgi:excisionase family DNA binding protein